MYSFATESVDDLYAPEVLNRAIKDWIEAEEDPERTPEQGTTKAAAPKDSSTLPHPVFASQEEFERVPSTQTSPKSSIELSRTFTDKLFQIVRNSDELPPLNLSNSRSYSAYSRAVSVDSASSKPSTVIHSTLSMKSHQRCYCCYLPTSGHFSLCCVCCVVCIPCYHSDIYLPSHSCQLLLCEGAGSYYNSVNISDIKVSTQYSLCFDVMCCLCCGHYYCCVWDWIADGEFICQCSKCSNQFINLHRDIYNWTLEFFRSFSTPR